MAKPAGGDGRQQNRERPSQNSNRSSSNRRSNPVETAFSRIRRRLQGN